MGYAKVAFKVAFLVALAVGFAFPVFAWGDEGEAAKEILVTSVQGGQESPDDLTQVVLGFKDDSQQGGLTPAVDLGHASQESIAELRQDARKPVDDLVKSGSAQAGELRADFEISPALESASVDEGAITADTAISGEEQESGFEKDPHS